MADIELPAVHLPIESKSTDSARQAALELAQLSPTEEPLLISKDSSREDAGLLLQSTANSSPAAVDSDPPPFSDPQNHTSLDRPLNVTDALSYLDAVKNQFQDQPNVYNHFLDIMKEFKSQVIDTPGVIKRVSHLFNGHAVLIQGFNTFLPVGYRIECSKDAHDSNFITVTTPTGTTMQTTNNGPGKGPILWSTTEALATSAPPAVVAAPTRPPSADPKPEGQAMEPAVQYVQKIKQRCDAETYRQFLDILSRYHHKPETIDEEEVSKQIARLFKDAPDLRSDFRIFMPEKSRQLLDDVPSSSRSDKAKQRKAEPAASSSILPQKRKRKPVEKEIVETLPRALPSKTKKVKHTPAQDLTPSSYKARASPPPARRRPASRAPAAAVIPAPEDTHTYVFFDRVKRALDDNRETYNEFLKLVNLFTQDFIDTARLVRESRNFLGDGELMSMLREIVGWDERREKEYWTEEPAATSSWVRPTIVGRNFGPRPTKPELDVQFGSYRRIPAAEANVTCSGRDEMCRLVLNDEWVSHPTWSSEDIGFFTPRMNIYEEALHRSEEERHEYDFHIEAVVRTITMLEPLNNKMASLSPEDRGSYKPKPNLNGQIKSIHHRVIKKIYGREAGLSVIHAMQDTPALAIPVVLQRLKQKEEEWKRAQREWNKVWREVDARNYSKSLDHQVILFKTADKKAITTKAFVHQIETAREEQMTKRASLIDPLFARTRPRHQLEFVMDDTQVLQDALKLTFSFLDRTQAQINAAERKRIEGFFRSFVPLFFMLDPVAFNVAFVVQDTVDGELSDDLSVADDAVEASGGSSSPRVAGKSRKNGGAPSAGSGSGDLRKKLLKSEQAKSSNRKTPKYGSPSISRLSSPVPMDEDQSEIESIPQNRRPPQRNIFFTNTVFYALLRLLEVLYSRLALFKGIAAKLATQNPSQAPKDPGSFPHPDNVKLGDRASHVEHFYDILLESCERLFDNELEQHVFEDQMRFMFGIKDAYKIFTIDKVIGCLIKQVQLLFGDGKSLDLLEILKRERALALPTTQDLLNSRKSAEKVLGPDENLFRVDWLPDSRLMTFQLIGKDDSSFDDSEVLTGRWQLYINSFVSSEATEGVPASRARRPFLRKFVNLALAVQDALPNVATQDSLEIKICVRTYRLFYVSKSEDYLFRLRTVEEVAAATKQLERKASFRRKWLEGRA
ncbi:histone deacetylase complex, SIN3 component [Mycena belliarum]|uniref:Histone deacetylase complex, SIN3 component n=1 Tax=Mycena belliarum TaxID=1033014 RepID=A0AAD6UJF6_9AGAR|nr:histone deacetylase complex, SIN3 component [Mycena belliae]